MASSLGEAVAPKQGRMAVVEVRERILLFPNVSKVQYCPEKSDVLERSHDTPSLRSDGPRRRSLSWR